METSLFQNHGCVEKCPISAQLFCFSENDEAKSRALDNLGRVYARTGQYDKAIQM